MGSQIGTRFLGAALLATAAMTATAVALAQPESSRCEEAPVRMGRSDPDDMAWMTQLIEWLRGASEVPVGPLIDVFGRPENPAVCSTEGVSSSFEARSSPFVMSATARNEGARGVSVRFRYHPTRRPSRRSLQRAIGPLRYQRSHFVCGGGLPSRTRPSFTTTLELPSLNVHFRLVVDRESRVEEIELSVYARAR